ncbi:MAG: FHA domain-containing protein [Planctomycetota bacterium]
MSTSSESYIQNLLNAPVTLHFSAENGSPQEFDLDDGQTIFAGTGAICGVQLEGDGIQTMHAMFQLTDGQLTVQDWNTGGGTLINGRAVDGVEPFNPEDTITVGAYSIRVSDSDGPQKSVAVLSTIVETEPEADEQKYECVEQNDVDQNDSVRNASPVSLPEPVQHEDFGQAPYVEEEFPGETPDSIDVFNDFSEFDHVPETDEAEPLAELSGGFVPSTDDLQLLHEEIEHLQFEIAQRDAAIVELSEGNASEERLHGSENEDMERLTQRLHQLVEELDSSDQRILLVEEQLQMSEEANAAEQDERKHLEAWVTEIEEVVSGKLSEFKAEQDQLQTRIDEITRERNSAVNQLRNLSRNSGSARQARAAETGVLRSELDQARRLLSDQQVLIEKMQEASEAAQESAGSVSSEAVQKLEEQIRQLEVDASQDRAVIARQKAELAQAHSDLDHALKSRKKLGDDDCRIQAMRLHLRELHDEDLQARKEQRENSLAGRLTKIWKRVSN